MLIQIEKVLADSIAKGFVSAPDTVKAVITPHKVAEDIKNFDWNQIVDKLADSVFDFTLRLFAAILVFYVGKFIINKIHKILKAVLLARGVDRSLSTFTQSFVKISLMFILVISVIGIIGIETSSFIAIFASAGVAIGMALSGTLQNFAGGVLLLFLKPFKIGDYIEFGEFKGFVKEIQIFHTIIVSRNNERIIIPNGGLSTGSITNITAEDYRRIEWKVSISYGDNVAKARELVLDMLHSDERVLKDSVPLEDVDNLVIKTTQEETQHEAEPETETHLTWWQKLFKKKKAVEARAAEWHAEKIKAVLSNIPYRDCRPVIYLTELNNSSVDLLIRAWVKSENYWEVYYEINEKIYTSFPQNGLTFPFPQVDLHIKERPGNDSTHPANLNE